MIIGWDAGRCASCDGRPAPISTIVDDPWVATIWMYHRAGNISKMKMKRLVKFVPGDTNMFD